MKMGRRQGGVGEDDMSRQAATPVVTLSAR
jgi:hypothetical protein